MKAITKIKKICHVLFLLFVFGAGVTCSDVFVEKTEAAHLKIENTRFILSVVGPV